MLEGGGTVFVGLVTGAEADVGNVETHDNDFIGWLWVRDIDGHKYVYEVLLKGKSSK